MRQILKWRWLSILRVAASVTISLAVLYLAAFRLLPRILSWEGKPALETMVWSHEILDRNGETIQVRPVNEDGLRRIFVPRKDFPPGLLSIVRRSEDRRFYFHPGFDFISLGRAALGYARYESLSGGGSTISMQLARMLSPRVPGAPINPKVKAREIWQALQIESRYSKNEILEFYINLVPFGRNIQGYPAAARLYFGRNLQELTAEEICMLTVIPRAPARFDPFLNSNENLRAASDLAGKDLEEAATARLLAEPADWPFQAPHFTLKIMEGLDDWPNLRRRGMEAVQTSLDLSLQRDAEALLKYYVEIAGDYRIGNGAMMLADPQSMDILAYVGSSDFYDIESSGQIDGVSMLREPGSTLKPLLYAEALENGWTASTIVPDIPMEFGGEFAYSPRNYNEQYHGPVRLRQALAASLNIPAVYTLERLGVESFTEKLIQAGFESLDDQRSRLGVSLAVGGGEVSLAELVQAYGVLYSGGLSRDGSRVWSAETTDIITDIISSSDDRVMTFGRGGPVRFDYPAAIKTGTSNQFNNIWAVGFTSDLIGAVWMGNFDGSTVIAAPGSSLPASVLHEAFDNWSSKGDLPRYSELETHNICSLSGLEATPLCPYVIEEIFAYGTAPAPCDWHVKAVGGGPPELRYPQEYASWARSYGYNMGFSETAGLGIVSPHEGAVYYLDSGNPGSIRIRLSGSGPAVLSQDGKVLFQGTLPAEIFWPLEEGVRTFTLEQNEARVSRRIEVR